MLTIFATPKPFRGHIGIIQRNAIRSWLQLRPACEILLLGNDEGTAELAAELKVKHITDVERNEQGTPLVNSVFARAEAVAIHPRLCYLNADIILMSDFLPAVVTVAKEKDRSLMVGRRCDLNVNESIDFSGNWEQELRRRIRQHGRLQAHGAIDYFVFPKGLWGAIPSFAIGRPRWDNWMVYSAVSRNIPTVDLSKRVTVVHQNHDYSHHPLGEGLWEGLEAKRNLVLAGGPPHLYTLLDSQYRLTDTGIYRNISVGRAYHRLTSLTERYNILRPILGLLIAMRGMLGVCKRRLGF